MKKLLSGKFYIDKTYLQICHRVVSTVNLGFEFPGFGFQVNTTNDKYAFNKAEEVQTRVSLQLKIVNKSTNSTF